MCPQEGGTGAAAGRAPALFSESACIDTSRTRRAWECSAPVVGISRLLPWEVCLVVRAVVRSAGLHVQAADWPLMFRDTRFDKHSSRLVRGVRPPHVYCAASVSGTAPM